MNAGVVVVGVVSARLDGKSLIIGSEHVEDGSDLAGGSGEDDAGWFKRTACGRPVLMLLRDIR